MHARLKIAPTGWSYTFLREKFSHLSRYESNEYACHSRGACPKFIGGFRGFKCFFDVIT